MLGWKDCAPSHPVLGGDPSGLTAASMDKPPIKDRQTTRYKISYKDVLYNIRNTNIL